METILLGAQVLVFTTYVSFSRSVNNIVFLNSKYVEFSANSSSSIRSKKKLKAIDCCVRLMETTHHQFQVVRSGLDDFKSGNFVKKVVSFIK